jgi:1,5-anhydro-D-fructose reductase (1,5-anhydro-D-mannitol-forming)
VEGREQKAGGISVSALMRLAIWGDGERAGLVAAIEAGAGMALAADAEGDAIVVACASRDEALAQSRAALATGKPTLCLTLPTALTALDELAALAAQHGTVLSLPNELRYLPATAALREAVVRGDTGPIISVFASWHTSQALGDPLDVLGPPTLDLLGWCLPGAIERAQVTAGPLFGPERGAAALTLRGQDGIVRTIELAVALPAGYAQADELLIEVLGEEAALRAEPFNQAITIAGTQGQWRQEWGAEAIGPILDAFVSAVRAGQEPPDSPAQLRPTLALLAELRAAAADGAARVMTNDE